MPKKKFFSIPLLLILLMFFQSGIAGTKSSGELTEKMERGFVDHRQFVSPKYFYTTCRDLSALARLLADGKLDDSYIPILYTCSTYLRASEDWFLSTLRTTHGIKFLECYAANSEISKLSTADLSTLFFSYLNLNKDLLDDPRTDTPLIFLQAVLSEYPIPTQCKN